MTNWRLTFLVAMVVAIAFSAQAAPIEETAESTLFGARKLDAKGRNERIDRELALLGVQPLAAVSRAASECREAVLEARWAAASEAPAGVKINPEPSSVLVWATSAVGLAAGLYGLHRRRSVPVG